MSDESEQLDKLATIHYGKSPSEVLAEDGPFPIVGTGGKYGNANKAMFNAPAVVVPRKGSLGNPQLLLEPFWPVDTTYAVVPKNDVDVRWLYYNLLDFDLTKLNEATGVPSISRDWLKKIRFFNPDKEQKRKIGEILQGVDHVIEKTESLIAKYQQIKAGLMHGLFTRGVTTDGKLRPTREQAPELYKETPIGWIPEEWGISVVRDCGSVQLGRQRSPDKHSGKWTTPYLRVANVFDGFIDYSDVLEMDFTPAERESYSVKNGDILLNEGQSLELVGRSAVYTGPGNQFCFQNTLARFRCDVSHDHFFYGFLFKWWLDNDRFIQIAKQTTSVAHLGADRFARMLCPTVTYDEQVRISKRLQSVQDQIEAERSVLDKLKYEKAGLMHDLLTGKVRIPADIVAQEPASV